MLKSQNLNLNLNQNKEDWKIELNKSFEKFNYKTMEIENSTKIENFSDTDNTEEKIIKINSSGSENSENENSRILKKSKKEKKTENFTEENHENIQYEIISIYKNQIFLRKKKIRQVN
jgi:hypothetical protein